MKKLIGFLVASLLVTSVKAAGVDSSGGDEIFGSKASKGVARLVTVENQKPFWLSVSGDAAVALYNALDVKESFRKEDPTDYVVTKTGVHIRCEKHVIIENKTTQETVECELHISEKGEMISPE